MNEITIGDKIYISSKRAAEITGYAKDYVGQLCREGHVDAKMVGRSWYVYEPSIRAHRFGEEAVVATEPEAAPVAANGDAKAQADSAPEPVSTWESPVYKAEPFEMVPEMPDTTSAQSLTDMQSAWKEWFDRKQQQPEVSPVESPEVIDDSSAAYEAAPVEQEAWVEAPRPVYEDAADPETESFEAESEEIAVPLRRLVEEEPEAYEEEDAEPIVIHHIEQPVAARREVPTVFAQNEGVSEARVITEKVVRRRKRRSHGSYVPATALLVGLSILALAIAAVGTGVTEKYVSTYGAENPIIKFLVGTSEFNRQ